MIVVYPDYFKEFQCIQGACQHNCCIGWEIDIDDEKHSYYQQVTGDLGKKLRKSISTEGELHFILADGERCPFLNENNLCDLILILGEEALCNICREHPRFYNEIDDRIECGLGLCCEEAGRLILGRKEAMTLLIESDEKNSSNGETATPVLEKRAQLFGLLQDRTASLTQRIKNVLAHLGSSSLPLNSVAYASELYRLERLDEKWSFLLEDLMEQNPPSREEICDFEKAVGELFCAFEQFSIYLLYRHYATAFDEKDAKARALFSLQSTALLIDLAFYKWKAQGLLTLADVVEFARLFSSEIEYSEENTEALFDLFYDFNNE